MIHISISAEIENLISAGTGKPAHGPQAAPRPGEADTAPWCPPISGMSVISPVSAELESALNERFERRKFTRRNDLSSAVRLTIAIEALHIQMNSLWGKITDLAGRHNISRTFVYKLSSTLREAAQFLFGEKAESSLFTSPFASPFTSMREAAVQAILSLRLEGGNSLNAISTIMERFELDFSSVGFISRTLSRIGGLLPMTISPENDAAQYL
ncbi:MAG: hypothetical protein GY862_08430, partial [Gammaproteobacteria bacterium]|nr:hypothetical protein [Gammaproteobacteria bacterium]